MPGINVGAALAPTGNFDGGANELRHGTNFISGISRANRCTVVSA